jgi:hypothetical protein
VSGVFFAIQPSLFAVSLLLFAYSDLWPYEISFYYQFIGKKWTLNFHDDVNAPCKKYSI